MRISVRRSFTFGLGYIVFCIVLELSIRIRFIISILNRYISVVALVVLVLTSTVRWCAFKSDLINAARDLYLLRKI